MNKKKQYHIEHDHSKQREEETKVKQEVYKNLINNNGASTDSKPNKSKSSIGASHTERFEAKVNNFSEEHVNILQKLSGGLQRTYKTSMQERSQRWKNVYDSTIN